MKLSKIGLLGLIASASFSQNSYAQFFIPGNIRAQANAKDNLPILPIEDQRETKEQTPRDSSALAPLNPYSTKDPNQIIHLEYFDHNIEQLPDEKDHEYLARIREIKANSRWPAITQINRKMKAGISLYYNIWEGYPYEITIKEGDSELKSYDGVVNNKGKIEGLDDLFVFSLNSTNAKNEQYTVEVEAKIRAKSYPGDIVASEKRKIMID